MNKYYIPEINLKQIKNNNILKKLENKFHMTTKKLEIIITNGGFYKLESDKLNKMISKITDLNNLKGIRISTSSYFIKKTHLKKNINYLYKSVITISNKSKNSIQILSKHKKVLEIYGVKRLNSILKDKPIIKPEKKLL